MNPGISNLIAEHRQWVLASLVGRFRDIELAEDALQEASLQAWTLWPKQGIPNAPAHWLLTTAKNKILDQIKHQQVVKRHQSNAADLYERNAPDTPKLGLSDDRLKMLFMCCHPALNIESQVALTLNTMTGLNAKQLAPIFLLKPSTMAQRLVRIKTKIKKSGIPFKTPEPENLSEKLNATLRVIYLIFNQGHYNPEQSDTLEVNYANLALGLATSLNVLLPKQAELLGLLALMCFHSARFPARQQARFMTLEAQDRSLWDSQLTQQADLYFSQATALKVLGPYQIQAAISGVHNQAQSFPETDWQQICLLYEKLMTIHSSPVVALNWAVANAHNGQPELAMKRLNAIKNCPQMQEHLPFALAKAHVHQSLNQQQLALHWLDAAKNLSQHQTQQAWIQDQMDQLSLER